MKTVYRTEDGKEFDSVEEAEIHEKKIRLRSRVLSFITYYYLGNRVLDEDLFDRVFDEQLLKAVCKRMDELGIG